MNREEEQCWNNLREKLIALESQHGSQDGTDYSRKARLFACASARTIWSFLGDERSRHAVDVAERRADGLATDAELAEAWAFASTAIKGQASRTAYHSADKGVWQAARMTMSYAFDAGTEGLGVAGSPERIRQLRSLFDCIFGTLPFTPRPVEAAWLQWQDATVLRMATGIYEDRAFDRMPVLADALLDAGCDEEAVLGHCREQGGVHARGCWVLDLLLGKE